MTDLLTTRQVQDLLQVDRTTIYRMVEGGQLPAVRVGKQWRFRRADLARWLDPLGSEIGFPTGAANGASMQAGRVAESSPLADLLPMPATQLLQDAFADALGVTILVTDMEGRPITRAGNPCGLYSAVMADAEAVAHCVADWGRMAGLLTLEPRFAPNELGVLCARGLIRYGRELKGMVFIGGIAPDVWPPSEAEALVIAQRMGLAPETLAAHLSEVHTLDAAGRERVLGFVQRIADILSHLLEDRSALAARLHAIASLTTL
jgi:excisionase family DNA binding protein